MTISILSPLQKPPETVKEVLNLFPEIPPLEKEVLLAKLLHKEKEFIYTHPETRLSPDEVKQFKEMCVRRLRGEPVAYIIEEKEFFSINFVVKRGVFIPRPETEVLVEEGIKIAKEMKAERILDVGAGCGAIGITLAVNLPACSVVLSDISQRAIKVAYENVRKTGVEDKVKVVCGDWFSHFAREKFDIILSNPPYLKKEEYQKTPELTFEPEEAFVGGEDGLLFIRKTIREGVDYLKKTGYILMEIGYAQAESVRRECERSGFKIYFVRDLTGIKRVVVLKK